MLLDSKRYLATPYYRLGWHGLPGRPGRRRWPSVGPTGLHGRSVWVACSRSASRPSLVRWLPCASFCIFPHCSAFFCIPGRPARADRLRNAECKKCQECRMPHAKNAQCPTLLCEAATQGEARVPTLLCEAATQGEARVPNATCPKCQNMKKVPELRGPTAVSRFGRLSTVFGKDIITRCSGGRQEKDGAGRARPDDWTVWVNRGQSRRKREAPAANPYGLFGRRHIPKTHRRRRCGFRPRKHVPKGRRHPFLFLAQPTSCSCFLPRPRDEAPLDGRQVNIF